MRDTLGPICTTPDFAHVFPNDGQPVDAPAHLALVTIMQGAEGLSDAQAADAVRARIDWNYALALKLTDPGFDVSVLSAFRSRLIAGQAETFLFDTMRTLFRQQRLLKGRGASARIPRMCLPPSNSSTAWRALGKQYGTP
jgi:transposase